jgi:glycosyltransferase involved in cell wall biosynthesis
MRILHIVGSISPACGGPTEAIRMLIQYAPPGYSSEVVTLNDPAEPFLASFPFKITALGSPKKSWYVPALTRWLRANRDRFDGVMLHGLWEYTGVAVLRAIAGHKPYAVFPHGMLDPYFKRRFPAKHAKKWLYWLLNDYWLLRRAFCVLFTTQTEADLARQSFWLSRWTPMVVALGAEPPPRDPAISIPAFYDCCPEVSARGPGLELRRFLLFLGRIDPKKGCDLLLQAFATIAADEPALHLVMAGPDAANWQLSLHAIAERAGAGDRVHWPGMLRGDAKWGAFAACEAFILPSHQENFGIAVVEALASVRPVLLSNQINIAADIAADGCGLVEPDTLAGTTRLLQRWLALDPARRDEMSRRALTTFAMRYDMRRNTEIILRVFEPAAQSAPTALAQEAR